MLLKILKMSMDDPALAEVWPEYEPGLSRNGIVSTSAA
jgi:hypothetical protein